MNKFIYQLWGSGVVFLCSIAIAIPVNSQVTSDGTVLTNVTTSDNLKFNVNDGSQVGNNLFHSFNEFSVPIGGSVSFNNDLSVQNIISRVTGGSISNIDGLIQARGDANFFLINPQGIIFGSQAQIKIKGSFLATTANSIKFADGSFFSATNAQSQPLLTISAPIGLQFGNNPGSIQNQSQATRFFPEFEEEFHVGLEVGVGKTLALVGGDVLLENGLIYAPGGKVELGSVAGSSFVSLVPSNAGWNLGYERVESFQNIELSPESFINTTGATNSGDILLRGNRITINQSDLLAFNDGENLGGKINIKALESIELNNGQLNTVAFSNGTAGDIIIDTKKLIVGNSSFINASSENANGQGGNIFIYASNSVEIDGNGRLSQITTQAFANGNAGNIQLTTGKLILSEGGQITSSTRGGSSGNAGIINIDATESILVSGQGQTFSGTITKSGIFSETTGTSLDTGQPTTGDGGLLSINTERLIVQDGGTISVAATDGSIGRAGILEINANNSVEVSGVGSSLQATSDSPQPAGNLTIDTNKLIVQDGGEISVSSTNTGNSGNLRIDARTVRLSDRAKIKSTSLLGTGGGNISLENANSVLIRGNSEISTNAQGQGNGGDIAISTKVLTLIQNSNITANASGAGNGGNISIATQGLFIAPDSRITASSDEGIDGVVEIDRLENDPKNALLTLPSEPVNIAGLIAQGCSSSIARGSKFVITGRGGLPPNPQEAFRGEVALADLGQPVTEVTNQAKVVAPTNGKTSEISLVEAQGWIIGDNGSVVLTASAPNITPSIPWMKANSCHGS